MAAMTTKPLSKLLAPPKPKKKKGPKPKPTPRACVCGCNEMTKGGEFLPGHDARHKAALIREVKAGGNDEAYAELERRGWLHFLDKSRNNDRVQAERKTGTKTRTPKLVVLEGGSTLTTEQLAVQRTNRYLKAKAVSELLASIGRFGKSSGERRLEVQLDDEWLESIIQGTHPDLTDDDRAKIRGLQ